MTTNYRRGSDFERRAKAKLESQGYVVFRTAGSRSAVDLIAFPPWTKAIGAVPRLIQCKSGKRGISGKDKLALAALASTCGAIPVVCTRGLTFTVLGAEAA